MAGRIYTVQITASALAAARTLLYGTAPSTMLLEILETHVTDADNETNQQLKATWQRVTSGSPTGTSLTPSKHENGGPAASSTWLGNITASEPTYTANTEVGMMGFPSLGGYHWEPVPGTGLIVPPSGIVGLRLLEAPATATNIVATAVVREIG